MASKKIVYVIVEGPSDDTALGLALSNLYDKEAVYVEITHGDITSSDKSEVGNIVSRIGNLVKGYARSSYLRASDFLEIIHVIDTDGVFVPDACITEDPSCEKVFYTPTVIRTDKPVEIRKRNAKKKDILQKLASLGKVWGIQYNAYYMSCNLDHVLYDKQNSTDEEKENDSYAFAMKYKNDTNGFLRFLCESSFSVGGGYKESWKFIQEGLHSLERYSNLCIGLERFRSEGG